MKLAIFYTGLFRTFEKTYKYLFENVLLNDECHIFACIDKADEDKKEILEEKLGKHLKTICFVEKYNEEMRDIWNNHVFLALNGKVHHSWIDYLLHRSGSVFEYYQLYKCYQNMIEYENENNIKYDYVLRIRLDMIINQKIDFSWLNIQEQDVEIRIEKIKKIYNTSDQEKITMILIQTILNPGIILNERCIENELCIYDENSIDGTFCNNLDENIRQVITCSPENFVQNLVKYIHTGDYMLTIRKNLSFLFKREYADNICTLVWNYGKYPYYKPHDYWFNAESQLQNVLVKTGKSIFDYTAYFEDKSLYEYNPNNYFEQDETIKNIDILYFLVRY